MQTLGCQMVQWWEYQWIYQCFFIGRTSGYSEPCHEHSNLHCQNTVGFKELHQCGGVMYCSICQVGQVCINAGKVVVCDIPGRSRCCIDSSNEVGSINVTV